jgi:hypothetical protein
MTSAILRFIIIVATFLLCSALAGFSGAIAMGLTEGESFLPWFVWGWFATLITAVSAAVPAALLIILAEWKSIRAAWFYCGFGSVVGVGLAYAMAPNVWLPLFGIILGAIIGAIYWALAGRKAGALKEQGGEKTLLILLALTALIVAAAYIIL